MHGFPSVVRAVQVQGGVIVASMHPAPLVGSAQ
jgi:hypothetical protein